MTKKTKRPYNSTRRQAQARETRRQIVEAACQLFAEYGYTGATIEAIAQEAGVAPETIFAIFGNKRSVLAALIDVSVGGDDQPVALLQRPGPQTVLEETDPVRQLQLFAEDISTILERVAPVFEIMRAAAKTEPDIAALLRNLLAERLRNLTVVAQRLAAHAALRAELTVAQAAETIWTMTSPEVFNLLTLDRGWSRARYVQWLSDTLIRLLLP
jgi:TetR/AcrR family transcriptional regulator, regulator of autoinduction and epiphytic fitness